MLQLLRPHLPYAARRSPLFARDLPAQIRRSPTASRALHTPLSHALRRTSASRSACRLLTS